MKKYDFIVVGSGCAGLGAGLELAYNGKKVLMIEQHNIPGGCATSFKRGRFEFDPSLHELCSVGSEEKPGGVRELLDKFGVKLEWSRVDDCFRCVSVYSDGTPMDVTMPCGIPEFIDKMEYYVPGTKQKMVEFFELFDEIDEGTNYASQDKYNLIKLMVKYPNFLKTGSYDTMSILKALDLPQKCIDILSVYWSYLGVDMDHLNFVHYVSMVKSYVELGAYIPTHTSHDISVSMVERFKEMGGEIWFNCRASEFIFEGNKCTGVKTNLGTVYADCVMANINPDIIFGKMMDKSIVPEKEKKLSAARNRLLGARMFTMHIGLNTTAEKLGIKDYSIFLPDSSDSTAEYNSLKSVDTNNYSIFLCYNICNPKASPEGTCQVSFTTMFAAPDDWNDVKDEDYYALKNKVCAKIINNLKEKTGIDIAPYIEEIAISSPWTFARYIGVPEGSVYGFETRDWDNIMARTMSMAQDYNINGLIPIGTSGIRGDGYSSCLMSGSIMAKFALKKYGKGGNK